MSDFGLAIVIGFVIGALYIIIVDFAFEAVRISKRRLMQRLRKHERL